MRRWWYRRILMIMVLFTTMMCTGFVVQDIQLKSEDQQVNSDASADNMLIPGGAPIGIYMETDGIYVLGVEKITGIDGQESTPAENVVQTGDYILKINGSTVEDKMQLVEQVSNLQEESVILCVRREEDIFDVKMKAVLDENEDYKLGIWVKDNVQGLGTLTYLTMDDGFGALGHGIHDSDTDDLLEIESGNVYETSIIGVEKSQYGEPGGLKGVIVYDDSKKIGTIEGNSDSGIKGTINQTEKLSLTNEPVEIAEKDEIEIGPATMLCTIDNKIIEYQIEICNTDRYCKSENKEILIEVTDNRLLSKTGGIVQGMSGSPILQNGKIIGAITHVLVNNPAKGYAIWIGNMLN